MVGRLLFTSPLVVSTDFDLIYTAEVSELPWQLESHPQLPAMALSSLLSLPPVPSPLLLLQASLQTFSGPGSAPLDSLLLAALRHDALEVVSLASSELSNWWLAAHLADLLNLKEALSPQPE